MNVEIKNCRSIDNAFISIEPGRLNVKFAPNGTGKSSIAKAIVSAVNGQRGDNLVPFKWLQEDAAEQHPFYVNGLDEIASVEVFDENYVQSVVFQQDSMFPGSFDAFIRTPEFVDTERKLRNQLRTLVELAECDEVRKCSSDLETFLAGLIGGSGLSRKKQPKASSPAVKALSDGNTWAHEDPLLAPFKPVFGPGPFKKWALWHKQGGDYLAIMGETCPYCGQSVSNVEERIDAVGNVFDSTKAGNIERLLEAVSIGGPYMSEVTAETLKKIVDSVDPITDQAREFIGKVAWDAQVIIDTLAKLRTVSSFFDLSKAEDLDKRLSNCKLDINLINNFKSVKCCELAAGINSAVEAAMANTGKLKGLVNKQKSSLANSLKGRRIEINAFLDSAGYPYHVEFSGFDDEKCSIKLVHKSAWVVANSKEALSYGERNAFSLVFFAYECMRKKPDLVILDDPISSFDGSKRYALLSMLFLGGVGEGTLKGKTVLLLTHDYGTLFDIEHTHKSAFQPSAKSCVLSNMNGEVKETVVCAQDMILTDNLYSNLAMSSRFLMTKLIYARKLLEIREEKSDAYDVISSLFHHRPAPARKNGELMSPAKVVNGTADLARIVGEPIDYPKLFETIENPTRMLALFVAAESNYERLQLARVATQAKSEDVALKERMDDSVHVGNGFLYQLDPTKFDLVSLQLVEKCWEELTALASRDECSC